MGKPYRECPHCGAHLDAGETCDCQEDPQNAADADRKDGSGLVAICRRVDGKSGAVEVYPVEKEG